MTCTRTNSIVPACALRGLLLAGCLLLPAALSPAHAVTAAEIANALARCQDEDAAAEPRALACTFLITTRGVEPSIRAEALLNRGIVHFDAGNIDTAISDFTEGIRLNPDYPALYAHRADAYREQERLELAVADLSKVIELLPQDADVRADRGEMHAQLGKQNEAIADFRAALKIDPNNDKARTGLTSLGAP